MSNIEVTTPDDGPDHRADTTAWHRFTANLGARCRKAWSAGVAGAVLAGSGVSVGSFIVNGSVDSEAVAAAAGAVVVGFVGGFVAAFFPRNA